jgi:peptidoglycan/LPS O-acetylase OafA/YrhL
MAMTTTGQRLYGADFLRAVACFTVLFHHLAQRMGSPVNYGPGTEWFRIFTMIGTSGVAMFFVLSGFLLARPFWQALDAGEPLPSLKIYALRRAARILPGFYLALALGFGLSIAFFGATLDGQLVLRAVVGMLLLSDWHWVTLFPVELNGPLWSIGFEITSYVLMPLGFLGVFALSRRTGQGWRTRLLWVGVIGLAILGHWIFTQTVRPPFKGRGWDHGLIGGAQFWMPRYNPIGFFAMFAIGSLAAGVSVKLATIRSLWCDFGALLGLGLAVAYLLTVYRAGQYPDGFAWLGAPYGFPLFHLTLGLFLAFAPSSDRLGRLLEPGIVRYLARISFGIYIYHYLVLDMTKRFLVPQFDHGQMPDATMFVVTAAGITLVSIGAAHLSFRYLENPVIQWARGLETRRTPTPRPVAA